MTIDLRAAPATPLRSRIGLFTAALVAACIAPQALAADYDPANRPEVAEMVRKLAGEGLDSAELSRVMTDARRSQSVLDAMSRPAERHLRWDQYRQIFIQPARISRGVQFVAEHLDAFERAERDYGVPREVIAAIIGIETDYGRVTGNHRVIDALSTLAFDYPPRQPFFRKELEAYLTLTEEQGLDPLSFKGSYAGAMGYPQFMPSSYQAYAVDFDGDGVRDLWREPVDAIGSVANYFAGHGWVQGLAVAAPARGPASPPEGIEVNSIERPAQRIASLADHGIVSTAELPEDLPVTPIALDFADGHYEYLLGTENFYVITRYNRSHLYAMAVTTLAESIKEALERQ